MVSKSQRILDRRLSAKVGGPGEEFETWIFRKIHFSNPLPNNARGSELSSSAPRKRIKIRRIRLALSGRHIVSGGLGANPQYT